MVIMPWYLPFSHFIPSILVIYCDRDGYCPEPGGGVETGAKGVQLVMGTGRGGYERFADSGSGCGTDGGGGVYIWDGEGDRLSRWEDNVANITSGTGPVPDGGVETRSKGVQAVVVTVQGGCGRDA